MIGLYPDNLKKLKDFATPNVIMRNNYISTELKKKFLFIISHAKFFINPFKTESKIFYMYQIPHKFEVFSTKNHHLLAEEFLKTK